MAKRNTARDAAMYQMMLRTGMIWEVESDQEVRVQIHQNAGASGGLLKRSIPANDAIPRAAVAAALAALRANYERRANKSNWPEEDDLDWRAAFDLACTELDAVIAALNLTPEETR